MEKNDKKITPKEEVKAVDEKKVTEEKEEVNQVDEKKIAEGKAKLGFLISDLNQSIKKYKRMFNSCGKLAFILKFLGLALSAIVTIILGLNLEPTRVFNGIALSISALTGVVSGLGAFFDFSPLSIKYKDTFDKLEMLKLKADYLIVENDHIPLEEIELFRDEYLTILEETNQFFQSVKADEMEPNKEEES